jgi:ABC-type antimicrobial peptide transport system permease subunit
MEEGYRVWLIDAPADRVSGLSEDIENALADYGADVTSAPVRLAEFHRVENTYLSTFQMLGGLGLLLGTAGLGAVLLRNVLERRRELAMLRALGYKQLHFFAMVISENGLLLLSGVFSGALCALLAITPVLFERGGRLPALSLALLLSGVVAAGLITSLVATRSALRAPLLNALKTE